MRRKTRTIIRQRAARRDVAARERCFTNSGSARVERSLTTLGVATVRV